MTPRTKTIVAVVVGGIVGLSAAMNNGTDDSYTPGGGGYSSTSTVSGSGVDPYTGNVYTYDYEPGDDTHDPSAPGYDPTLHGDNEIGPACGIFLSCNLTDR